MTAPATHTLLVIALAAITAAGLRAAAALGATGLLRVLAAATISATGAGLTVLGLGLVGLGASPLALTVAAVATWACARRFLPAPASSAASELGREWQQLPVALRLAAGAFAGALGAITVWVLLHPAFVGDGLSYHLPVVANWVAAGEPASLAPITTDAPIEFYPLTHELLTFWPAAIARSFVPVTIMSSFMLALAVLCAWSGARSLGAGRGASLLAVAAVATCPAVMIQLNSFTTDVPSFAWLLCCAALCAASPRSPGLLVAAVLAAGLAIGTKTTVAPLALICLGAALLASRHRLRPLRVPLGGAVAAASVVGGLWYLRTMLEHGSPLWPFVPAPWGSDGLVGFTEGVGRLLWDPSAASGRLDDYGRALWGGAALLVGGLAAAPLIARTCRVSVIAAVVGFAVLIWANAPTTAFPAGVVFDALQGGSTRYLLGAIAGGALALALAASQARAASAIAYGLLAVAVVLNLVGAARLGFVGDFEQVRPLQYDPMLPSAAVPLVGAVIGAVVVIALAHGLASPRRPGIPPSLRPLVAAAAALAAGIVLAVPAAGFVERSTKLASTPAAARALVRTPGWADGSEPVLIQGRMIGTLAGDELRHEQRLISPGAPCSLLEQAGKAGWIVIALSTVSETVPAESSPLFLFYERAKRVNADEQAAAACVAARAPVYEDAGGFRIYPPIDG